MLKKNKNCLLELKNIFFGYDSKKLVLDNVSLSIYKGEHICIVGANGCGKTTLLKLIVGLFKPSKGEMIFKNKQITNKNVRLLKSLSGYVFENPDNQFIGMSVEDEIAFGLENKCMPRDKMHSTIMHVAHFTNIEHLLKCSVSKLSGGEKQIVAIASILASDPEIIAFDEVTSMLDCKYKNRVRELIDLLHKKNNKTIISITHDMEEAAKADRIIVMHKGQIVLNGKPEQIFKNKKLSSLSIDKPFTNKLEDVLGKQLAKRVNYGK